MHVIYSTKTISKERRANVATLSLSVLLFLVSLSCRCTCAQVPTRFFNEHEREDSALTNSATGANEESDLNIIPMSFYRELDNITDESELIERFVDKDSIDPQLGLQENLKRNVERAAAVNPKPAICIPENTIVPLIPLNPNKNPNIIYIPKCTRVKRCGGCCSSSLMSCQPTETETITFALNSYLYKDTLQFVGKELVVVEQHVKCKCDCIAKKEDCLPNQIYNVQSCQCECTNPEEQQNCAEQHGLKTWDKNKCICVCHEQQSCTTGLIFDESQCKCIDPAEITSLSDRRRFILPAIPVTQP